MDKIKKEVIGMCKSCGCGSKKEKVYVCKKCGKTSDKPEVCCGEKMVEKKD